jgi:hypothetical protein
VRKKTTYQYFNEREMKDKFKMKQLKKWNCNKTSFFTDGDQGEKRGRRGKVSRVFLCYF